MSKYALRARAHHRVIVWCFVLINLYFKTVNGIFAKAKGTNKCLTDNGRKMCDSLPNHIPQQLKKSPMATSNTWQAVHYQIILP